MRILIDVDLTIVSDYFHDKVLSEIKKHFNYKNQDHIPALEEWYLDSLYGVIPYDLTEVFDQMHPEDMSWIYGATDLYDDARPEPGVKQFVDVATAMGHQVMFVSKCVGEHHLSKMCFMQRHFPDYPVFLTAKSTDRCLIEADMFIDDSIENHVAYSKVQPLQPRQYLRATPFNSDNIPKCVLERFYHWKDMLEAL